MAYPATVMIVSTKSLDEPRNRAAREFVRAIVDRDFGGTITAAARGLGVSYSALYEFLAGTRGAGMKLLEAVSAYSKQPIETIIGTGRVAEATPEPVPAATLADLEWFQPLATAIADTGFQPIAAIEAVGRSVRVASKTAPPMSPIDLMSLTELLVPFVIASRASASLRRGS